MSDDATDDPTADLDRRAFVASVLAGTGALAGCSSGGDGDGGDGTPTADTDTTEAGPTATATPTPTPGRFTKEDRTPPEPGSGTRQVEQLDRGLVSQFRFTGGNLLRWRLFGDDPDGIGFHVYRNGEKITEEPVTGATNYEDADGGYEATYAISPVIDGEEGDPGREVETLASGRIDIDLQKPTTSGDVTYSVKDGTVADLDGDGRLEIVVKWFPSGRVGNEPTPAMFDAYSIREGEHLWRIDVGHNVPVSNGAQPLAVYDYDGDGTAEVAIRAGDGTEMGDGSIIGEEGVHHLQGEEYFVNGPEYLVIADGETGAPLTRTEFLPSREPISSFGDDRGFRAGMLRTTPAYLDGARPSLVTCRGVYGRITMQAWDYRDGELTKRWSFDTQDGYPEYAGKGNHHVMVADVDDDGKDEIVYGACVIDHDGSGLHQVPSGHGDWTAVSDLVPRRDGMEIFQIHEASNAEYGASLRDAETGEILWGEHTGTDTARGMIADVDPERAGPEFWALAGVGTHSTADGYPQIHDEAVDSYNFCIWWDGTLTRELLDRGGTSGSSGRLFEYDPKASGRVNQIREFTGTTTTDGSKGWPVFSGDVLGDWREEVVFRAADSSQLRLYMTSEPTEHRIPNLLHDHQYRQALAWQNITYNMPPWPSFYLGTGMDGVPDFDVKPV